MKIAKKIKAYLSKSKCCDYEQYLRIKSRLTHVLNCEVIEYDGKSYSPEPMYKCDILFVIPPKAGDDGWSLGKGQYDTIEQWKKKKGNIRLFFVTKIDDTSMEVQVIGSPAVIAYNWQTDYAIYDKRKGTDCISFSSINDFNRFLADQKLIAEEIKPTDETDKFIYEIIL